MFTDIWYLICLDKQLASKRKRFNYNISDKAVEHWAIPVFTSCCKLFSICILHLVCWTDMWPEWNYSENSHHRTWFLKQIELKKQETRTWKSKSSGYRSLLTQNLNRWLVHLNLYRNAQWINKQKRSLMRHRTPSGAATSSSLRWNVAS